MGWHALVEQTEGGGGTSEGSVREENKKQELGCESEEREITLWSVI